MRGWVAGLLGWVALSLPAAAHETARNPRLMVFPKTISGGLILPVDLHTHSVFSDGSVWPDIRVQEAERDGLTALAVTEHIEYQPHAADIPHPDRNRSYNLASGMAKPDLLVIAGAEITRNMPPGHINAVFITDANALKALPPTLAPHATDYIQAMQDQIAALIARGAAYAAEGHVLFSIEAFPDYGQLSGRPLDEMIAGARVEVAPYKRHPADFVLWKPSKPGEPEWPSPWGAGRPGWHIECSAMIEAVLGLPIDIHGGGIDLTFPHHENELAQAR
jgi:hypothetical protein